MPRRPPKHWWDKCIDTLKGNKEIEDTKAICGYIWHHVMKKGTKKRILKGE